MDIRSGNKIMINRSVKLFIISHSNAYILFFPLWSDGCQYAEYSRTIVSMVHNNVQLLDATHCAHQKKF